MSRSKATRRQRNTKKHINDYLINVLINPAKISHNCYVTMSCVHVQKSGYVTELKKPWYLYGSITSIDHKLFARLILSLSRILYLRDATAFQMGIAKSFENFHYIPRILYLNTWCCSGKVVRFKETMLSLWVSYKFRSQIILYLILSLSRNLYQRYATPFYIMGIAYDFNITKLLRFNIGCPGTDVTELKKRCYLYGSVTWRV